MPPTIMEIQPAEPVAGSEIHVIGSGGYVQDTCGGCNESARAFALYLDHEHFGELTCYVNRCEGTAILSDSISPGLHCLSVEADKCEFEFQIASQ